jgi:hypothetical protein
MRLSIVEQEVCAWSEQKVKLCEQALARGLEWVIAACRRDPGQVRHNCREIAQWMERVRAAREFSKYDSSAALPRRGFQVEVAVPQ